MAALRGFATVTALRGFPPAPTLRAVAAMRAFVAVAGFRLAPALGAATAAGALTFAAVALFLRGFAGALGSKALLTSFAIPAPTAILRSVPAIIGVSLVGILEGNEV